ADTIESVINQSYRLWELIIIDDCSTDGSIKIIEEYAKGDDRISLAKLDRNNGRPAVPRNIGLKLAKGEYAAFLDSDDLWHPQKLELQIGLMEKDSLPFTCTAMVDFSSIDEVDKLTRHRHDASKLLTKRIFHNMLLRKNVIANSSVVIKRSLLPSPAFIEDPRYKAIEDYHCWLKIHEKIECSVKIMHNLLFYRLAENSISRSKFAMFKKNNLLYSEYNLNGRGLGAKKYLYLLSYIYFSIINRLIKGSI
ncbi:MAG: glycosyltransferase, partial [Thermodesulfobacteriota bacterium]